MSRRYAASRAATGALAVSSRRLRRASCWLAAAALTVAICAGCGDSTQTERTYPVSLRTLDEDGEPLANVELLASGTAVGRSNERGVLTVQTKGREGGQVTFEPRCPAGSKAQGQPASLRLRTLGDGPPPEVELTCERSKRMAALIVSAPGFGGLPVMVHNRELARTDYSGTAHVLLEGDPSTPLRVVLNTESRPKVVPPSPHKDLQIGSRDDIVVFAPELTEVRDPPPPKKHRVKKEKPPPVIRPEKLR